MIQAFSRFVVVVLLVGFASGAARSQQPAEEVVADILTAGETLLMSLDPAQQDKLVHDFDDHKQRRRWSNLPVRSVPRGGLRMGDLSPLQKENVYELIRATLSPAGYQQVIDNIHGDEVLGRRGNGQFSLDEFYVSFLGEPSASKPWMWQFGGHHLAINATISGDQVTLSPSLTGGQPMDYTFEGRTVRQHAIEEDLAFELIAALTPEQRGKAVLGDKYTNLNFGPTAEDIEPKQEGLCAAEMSDEQQSLLLRLIETRVAMLKPAHAEPEMANLTAEIDQTYFSWYGGTEEGSAATFRIQGPSVLIEYAPQSLGGNPMDHIHAMYRNPKNDYGAAIVGE